MKKYSKCLEVCCGSLASALAAVEGGADRIELCSALSLDGLTPSLGTLCVLHRSFPDLRIHVLIRPREGEFVYTEAEVQVMEQDICNAVDAGASAIVCGALTPGGTIDLPVTTRLVQAAGGLPFTFHRAFDLVPDKTEALQQLSTLGVARILTSGGASTAEDGIAVLRQLILMSASLHHPVTIMPGGGVNRHNVKRIIKETGAMEIHGSCSISLPDGQRQTAADEVRAVLNSLSNTCG
ncbi:MAG: copper homeostasis protein CutC [Bacteroidaceae bacterium]|nr:copper homeostasis protein CutC [Bacteroidaceae bacterium]